MTKNNEQIIIHGVDVKECKIFCSTFGNSLCNPTEDIREAMNCNDYPNCLYKQLKYLEKAFNYREKTYLTNLNNLADEAKFLREKLHNKEQECEELKKKIKSYQCNEKKRKSMHLCFQMFRKCFLQRCRK